jgi:hypothetical protein
MAACQDMDEGLEVVGEAGRTMEQDDDVESWKRVNLSG